MHLTNYAINKMNKKSFKENIVTPKKEEKDDSGSEDGEGEDSEPVKIDTTEEVDEKGHKRSIQWLMKYLYGKGHNIDKLKKEMYEAIIKCLCCA